MEENDVETSEGHEQNQPYLNPTQEILYPNTRFQETAVDYGDGRQKPQCERFLGELGGLDAKGEQHILAKDNAVASSEAKQDSLHRDEGRCKESRVSVGEFEVDLVAARTRKHATILQADDQGATRDNCASDPKEQCQPNTSGGLDDGSWRGEDAASDDTRDDEDIGTGPGKITTQGCGLGQNGVLDVAGGLGVAVDIVVAERW